MRKGGFKSLSLPEDIEYGQKKAVNNLTSFCKCLEEQRLGEENEKRSNGREIVESHDLQRPQRTRHKEENVFFHFIFNFLREWSKNYNTLDNKL